MFRRLLFVGGLTAASAVAQTVTITGSGSADYIDVSQLSTPHAIYARGGSDTVLASQGGDLIDASSGNDAVFANAGDDTIVGGTGNDRLDGGEGNDRFLVSGTNSGFDTVDGGPGSDRIDGTDADDTIGLSSSLTSVELIDAGAGYDTIQLANVPGLSISLAGVQLRGVELIRGGRKSDRITGSAGDDLIEGGRGNDIVDGGPGRDTLTCSGEFAAYRINGSPGSWTVTDLAGTDGVDSAISIEVLRFADGSWDGSVFTPIFAENRPPVARADSVATLEDSPVVIAVLQNDSDQDGDALTVESVTPAAHGTLTIRSDQKVMYVPHADFSGMDRFTYEIRDARYGRATAEVTINLAAVADAPEAQNDRSEAFPNRSATIAVLENDFDADGDALQLAGVGTSPVGARIEAVGNEIRYSSADGFTGVDRFSYTIEDASGRRATAMVEVTVYGDATGAALSQLLEAAPEGSWLRVNRNRFQDVWTPAPLRPTPGAQNPARIISAWASMAWDGNRRKLMFWGGGHANYSGNELYRFDTTTLRWERASLPSSIYNPLGNQEWFAIDGPLNAPIAAHTYDNQEYLASIDRFVTFGGGKFNADARFVLLDGVTPTGPYFWDPSRADPDAVGGSPGSQVNPGENPRIHGGRMWENRDTLATRGLGAVRPDKFVNGTTAYAPLGNKAALLLSESPGTGGRLFRYVVHDKTDPARDEWQLVGIRGDGYGDQGAGGYDSHRSLYVRTANSASGTTLVVWNLATAGPANRSFNVAPSDPSGQFVLARQHGMDYDSRRRRFVLWDGGPDVWSIQPPTGSGGAGTWLVEKLPVAAADELPVKADGALATGNINTLNGILGKWKYAAEFDAYLGVLNPERGDIWVYKPVGWQPM